MTKKKELQSEISNIDKLIKERISGKAPEVKEETKQPTHGETVIQNGVTYKWNYNTGKYEAIKQ